MGNAVARYLVAYVRAMGAHGVPIEAVTLQNEPENANNTPSMTMSAAQQAELIADHVGPAFTAARLPTRIIAYDHNCDDPGYQLAVLGTARAAPYVAGSGLHLYAGSASAMSRVHDTYADKPVWLTEQMVIDDPKRGQPTPVADRVARVLIASLTHSASGVLLWNLAADPGFGPHSGDGGCTICEGAITLDGDRVTRNVAYAAIAPFTRFVPPGSVRLGVTSSDPALAAVAFETQAGTVLNVANTSSLPRKLRLIDGLVSRTMIVANDAVATIRLPQ